MSFGPALRAFFITVAVAATGLAVAAQFMYPTALPFRVKIVDAHTWIVHPFENQPLPTQLKDGDRIDLATLDPATRDALAIVLMLGRLPEGHQYLLSVERDGMTARVPVTVGMNRLRGWDLLQSVLQGSTWLIMGIISLLLLWRGRDLAAFGLAAWAGSYVLGIAIVAFPAEGLPGLVICTVQQCCFVLARVGFFVMAAALARASLSRGALTAFGALFAALCLIGGALHVLAPLLLADGGSVEYMLPEYQLIHSWVYLVPVAMLALGYRRVEPEQRARLRWAIVSGSLLAVSVTLTNTVPAGNLLASVAADVFFSLTFVGMAYALLRHRVVDVSIVIDRTLVYGSMTALVVGVVAAVNSIALKVALPPGTGLLLQVVVPLSLGIVLGKVRAFMDRVVEQVFFRRKYQAEQALRAFAKRAGHIDQAGDLLQATAREVVRHTGTPAVAIYSAESEGFRRLGYAGQDIFPAALGNNDDAAVALKAEGAPMELQGLASALGPDGCVIPMLVLGNLRGLLVVKNRAGEHFGSDEKALLTQVARDVGAAWRILRARDNESLVAAMAAGTVPPKKAFAEAKKLSLGWAGG